MEDYQNILLDDTATLEEKNDAYDSLQALNNKKGETDNTSVTSLSLASTLSVSSSIVT